MTDEAMTLSEARAGYYRHSTKASDVARQLAFAGIALIWIFKKDGGDLPKVDASFVPAAMWFVAALGADLLQYVVATIAWGAFARWKEGQEGISEDSKFSAPPQLNWPALFFFGLKLICVVGGYVVLSRRLWGIFQ